MGKCIKCDGVGTYFDESRQESFPCEKCTAYPTKEEHMGTPMPGSVLKAIKFRGEADQFILGCERDTNDPFNNSGPIAMEQMLGRSGIFDVIERAEKLGDRYGEQGIFKLVYIGSPEECRHMIENDGL